MLEVGIFQGGAVDLPVVMTPAGVRVNAGTLTEAGAAKQRVALSQVRQGILAEELGFNYYFLTEHHFQPEGASHSPTPLLTQAAIATRTRRIRLGQLANILTWHHPLRLAEEAAVLDVLSGGRLEFGVGRGVQPRETETLGGPLGATNQDQERNRSYFEEAYEIVLRAWTEPSFAHQGEFFTLPPTYTQWHHNQTLAYFQRPETGRALEQVVRLGEPGGGAGVPPVLAASTTLREISVLPQPLQKPHPQVWQSVASPRSIDWAAAHGINAVALTEVPSKLKENVEHYYALCERHGWPDRLGRGPFKFGWDAARRRGYPFARYVHLLDRRDARADLERCRASIELLWDDYSNFRSVSALKEAGEQPVPQSRAPRVTGDLVMEKNVALVGSPDEVVEQILQIKETVGYDDLLFLCWFEIGGYSGEEIEEQMRIFAAECMPQLAAACGGLVQNPAVGPDFAPRTATADP